MYRGQTKHVVDGRDLGISYRYRLPYFNKDTRGYYRHEEWGSNSSRLGKNIFGLQTYFYDNILLDLGYHKDEHKNHNSLNDHYWKGKLTYSLPLGNVSSPQNIQSEGDDQLEEASIRHLLYEPVQRENRLYKYNGYIINIKFVN